jgi:hypothetical protein
MPPNSHRQAGGSWAAIGFVIVVAIGLATAGVTFLATDTPEPWRSFLPVLVPLAVVVVIVLIRSRRGRRRP